MICHEGPLGCKHLGGYYDNRTNETLWGCHKTEERWKADDDKIDCHYCADYEAA